MSNRSYLTIRSSASVAEKRAIRARWKEERIAKIRAARAAKKGKK